jgi:hypothetical protein
MLNKLFINDETISLQTDKEIVAQGKGEKYRKSTAFAPFSCLDVCCFSVILFSPFPVPPSLLFLPALCLLISNVRECSGF